jgi:ribosomal protein S27E
MPKSGGLRICPFCREEVGVHDARCPFCAEDLPAPAGGEGNAEKRIGSEPAKAVGGSRSAEGTIKRRFSLTAVLIVGIVTCGLLGGFYIWSSHNRFYVVSGSQGVAY